MKTSGTISQWSNIFMVQSAVTRLQMARRVPRRCFLVRVHRSADLRLVNLFMLFLHPQTRKQYKRLGCKIVDFCGQKIGMQKYETHITSDDCSERTSVVARAVDPSSVALSDSSLSISAVNSHALPSPSKPQVTRFWVNYGNYRLWKITQIKKRVKRFQNNFWWLVRT